MKHLFFFLLILLMLSNVKFGINADGGVNFRLTENTDAFGEVKYVFGGWDGWTLIGGIRF